MRYRGILACGNIYLTFLKKESSAYETTIPSVYPYQLLKQLVDFQETQQRNHATGADLGATLLNPVLSTLHNDKLSNFLRRMQI
jgi:hypothetical protein